MKGLMKGCGMVKAPRRNQQLYKWDKLETKKNLIFIDWRLVKYNSGNHG